MPGQPLTFDQRLQAMKAKLANKRAFAPTGSMPPVDPAMAGGAPPMDPAMSGGAPPMDPAMAGGAPMPAADPAMMAGGMDPAMMAGGGAPPPMDPTMAGGAPPPDPMSMGVMPDPNMPQDPMQMMMDMNSKIDTLTEVVQKLLKKLDEPAGQGAESLVPKEDAQAVDELTQDHQNADDPVSQQAKEELDKPDQGQSFIQKQLMGLQG